MDIGWKKGNPSVIGRYLFKESGRWPVCVRTIHWGAWESAQNPEWLYMNEKPLRNVIGQWYGLFQNHLIKKED